MNTFYRHKNTHKIAWNARRQVSLIDYIIVNRRVARKCLDVQAYRGLDMNFDHYLVQGTFHFNKPEIRKYKELKKPLNITSLDDDSSKWLYQKHMKANNPALILRRNGPTLNQL